MDCIELFKNAAVALQQDSRYLTLEHVRKANDADEALQTLIGDFNLARIQLNNEISAEEQDEARVAALNDDVNRMYGEIMNHEGMLAYNEAKKDCETLIQHIDAIINTAMNGGDPMLVQEPAAGGFSPSGCSSCSGCGG